MVKTVYLIRAVQFKSSGGYVKSLVREVGLNLRWHFLWFFRIRSLDNLFVFDCE